MNPQMITGEIDWNPILSQIDTTASLPTYRGDLKAALLEYADLTDHPQGEKLYRLAVEISRLTTCCDPEIIYWFSRLLSLIDHD